MKTSVFLNSLLLTLFIIIAGFTIAKSQCSITNFTVDPSECENDLFDVLITADYENTSDSFKIYGNGVNYGHFAYIDLPIQIEGLNADCSTFYAFVIQDLEDNNCFDSEYIDIQCCSCFILSVDFDISPYCESDTIWAEWIVFGGNFSEEGISVYISGEYYNSYEYEADDSYFFGIANPGTEYFDVVICDTGIPDCCSDAWEWENLCPISCVINNMYVEATPCADDMFDVWINFEYENTSDSFMIQANGLNYGNYAYNNLPILLEGFEGDCLTDYLFVVSDIENSECSAESIFGPVFCNCECEISNLELESSNCINNQYELTIDFDVQFPDNDYFEIWINDGFYIYEELENLPKTILVDNSEYELDFIEVCINDNYDCCIGEDIENPCFGYVENCNIYNIVADTTYCEDSLFNVLISAAYENTSDSFKIQGNGNYYGNFAYIDLPILLEGLEADCETNYEFAIIDLEFSDCSDAFDLGIQCCECIANISFGNEPICEEDSIWTSWYFSGENFSGEGVNVFINGELYKFLETNPNNEYYFGIANPDTDTFEIEICDAGYESCCGSMNIENPCYNSVECTIYDLVIEQTECTYGYFDVVIDFEYSDVGSSGFQVAGNGQNYGTFQYSDLPITIDSLQGDCITEYEFVVADIDHNDCLEATDFGVVCCSTVCEIYNLALEASDCQDNQYELALDFDVYSPGNDYYDIWINGENYGYYELENLPNTILVDNSDNELDSIQICINDMPDCCIDKNIENPCFGNVGECNIKNIVADVTTCEDSLFNVLISAEHENTSDSFKIQGNGIMYGHFAYNDLPILLEGLAADCETNYEFSIIDLEIENCHIGIDIDTVCCDPIANSNIDNQMYDIFYIFNSSKLILDFKSNQFDQVNIKVNDLLGQTLQENTIINASGIYYQDINLEFAQFKIAIIEMIKDNKVISLKTVKIIQM